MFYVVLFLCGACFGSAQPLVAQAIQQEYEFRSASQTEIEHALSKLRLSPIDRTLLKEAIYQQLALDLALLRLLQTQASTNPHATWSCKTNKLIQIIEAAQHFFAQYANLIVAGELPKILDGYWRIPRKLDALNLQDLSLKVTLVVALSKLNQTLDLEHSAIFHSTPLPPNLPLDLKNLTFFLGSELSFVHGGYAFGGQREDPRYFKYGRFGKPLGPQDCSSWISKLIDAQEAFSTSDFASYQHPDIRKRLLPKIVQSLEDIEPGMIWVTRKNNAGHVVLITEVDPEKNQLRVIEYGRNLPDYEGFGFRNIDWGNRPKDISDYWFTVQSSNETQEEL